MFKLPPEVQEAYNKARSDLEAKKAMFANLSDVNLAASAKYWMQYCAAPRRYFEGDPVYDSTFWHIIAPEMIRRLGASAIETILVPSDVKPGSIAFGVKDKDGLNVKTLSDKRLGAVINYLFMKGVPIYDGMETAKIEVIWSDFKLAFQAEVNVYDVSFKEEAK